MLWAWAEEQLGKPPAPGTPPPADAELSADGYWASIIRPEYSAPLAVWHRTTKGENRGKNRRSQQAAA